MSELSQGVIDAGIHVFKAAVEHGWDEEIIVLAVYRAMENTRILEANEPKPKFEPQPKSPGDKIISSTGTVTVQPRQPHP